MTCVDFELLFNGIEVYRMVEMVMKVSVLDVAADKKLMILCVILMSDKYDVILISLQYNPGKALVDMQHVGLWGSAVVAKERSLDEIFFFFSSTCTQTRFSHFFTTEIVKFLLKNR